MGKVICGIISPRVLNVGKCHINLSVLCLLVWFKCGGPLHLNATVPSATLTILVRPI